MQGYGAVIERGRVLEEEDGGWRIESLSRPGIKTPRLPSMNDDHYTPGELVYFFMFCDGKGMIVGRA